MICSLLTLMFAATPLCAAQVAVQDPSPVPVRAVKATVVRLETSDVQQVIRQAPDDATQPLPHAMVLIPGGATLVGTELEKIPEYGDHAADKMRHVVGESPRHTVTVEPFLLDLTEVTNLQWKVYLEATKRKPSNTLLTFNWTNDGEIPAGQDHFPVTNVNLPEIRDYLQWCGKRLPTEAEWTRAARGDDDRLYPWGPKWDPKLCRSGANGDNGPVTVGSFPAGATPYGVLDMVGNVFEWVDTPFRAYEGFTPYNYKQGKKTVPLTPDFNSTYKTIKGGGFSTVRLNSRIDVRLGMNTVDSDAAVGFRAARTEKPGVDVVRHALDRLLPPAFSQPDAIDFKDVFAQEVNGYDDARRVITDYRFLAFGHRAPSKLPPLSKLRDDSINTPLPLGVLTTSEPMLMKDMPVPGSAAVAHDPKAITVIPAGQFTLSFKGKGVSKAYKDKQREAKRAPKQKDAPEASPAAAPKDAPNAPPRGKAAKAAAEAEAEVEATAAANSDDPVSGEPSPGGAMVPWPGVGSINDIQEDVDFPQDADVILYSNSNNVVVAWSLCEDMREADFGTLAFASSEAGRTWRIEFSVDTLSRKMPRFTMTIHLAGQGLH